MGTSRALDNSGEPSADGCSADPFDAIVLAARHDDDAVTQLFVALHPKILRFLRSQEPRAADDIAAEVWLAVARSISEFEGGWNEFRAWCFSIVRRRLADHRRTAARRRTDVVDQATLEGRAGASRPDDEALDSLSGQAAASMIVALLKPEQAEVLLLRVLGDLDAEQVGALMGRSPNWVRVTQHRALRLLADRLGTGQLVQP